MSEPEGLQLVAAALSGGIFTGLGGKVWRWLRGAEGEISREAHIATLRSALDKAGIRFNSVTGACDALALAHEITRAVHDIPPAAEAAVALARQKLSEAVSVLESIGRDA